MIYKLEYRLGKDPHPHYRFYSALSSQIAVCMFEETCGGGSLTGQGATLLSIFPSEDPSPIVENEVISPPSEDSLKPIVRESS